MPDMSYKKYPMPIQDADIRKHNFEEVELGYTEETAIKEANRCLNCKNAPCIKGCPVNIDIPSFISSIKDGDAMKAYNIITKTSSLPAICGRVCPQEEQCEKHCVRGIKSEPVAIGRLERFAADFNFSHQKDAVKTERTEQCKNKKVAKSQINTILTYIIQNVIIVCGRSLHNKSVFRQQAGDLQAD